MSQTALFEFNIDESKITPNDLLLKINEIVGTESGLSSIVDLIDRNEGISSRESPSEDDLKFQSEMELASNQIISDLLSELGETDQPDNDLVTGVPFKSTKKWELVLGVYDDDEFQLFKEVVELLLHISDGDLFYFREPQGQGERDYNSAIEISLHTLEDFTPDMCELDTYIIIQVDYLVVKGVKGGNR